MLQRIEQVLDRCVRPQLLLHGGGIRSLGYADGVYRFELIGQCANCPSAYLETRENIRAALMQELPELLGVELVQTVSEDLLAQAKALLQHRPLGDRDA